MAWKPDNNSEFINDYNNGMTDFELAKKHEATIDQVKKYLTFLRKNNVIFDRKYANKIKGSYIENIKEDFKNFLLKPKTKKELINKYGNDVDDLLSLKYPGLNLFVQLNNYGENIYILLPEINKEEIKIQPRVWHYHTSQSTEGDFKQPYIMIQLPDKLFDNKNNEVVIAPLYDIHFGHYGHKKEKLLSYLRWIEETPNVLTFIGGDLLENALDEGRSMCYSQELPPTQQINDIIKRLAPIAHKVLFMLPGNHEWRTYKHAGIDPTKFIAEYLNIPYFSGPVYCSILGAGHKWKIYAFHGYTNSQTKGGKMNAAGRPRIFTDFINFFVSGHTHDPLVNNETCIVEDPVNCRLLYLPQWTVVCPSFMRWEQTYAYEKGWPPPGKGGVALKLYSNGNYIATLRDR